MVCGLVNALSVIFTLPVQVPLAVGANVTLIVQLEPAATVPLFLQGVPLLASAKWPLTVMVPSVSGVFPVFVSVTVFAPLVVPTVCEAKVRLLALNVACGLITWAVSRTRCGLAAVLSVMVRVAVEAVGLKIFAVAKMPTKIGQLFPAGKTPGSFVNSGVQKVMSPYSPTALPGPVMLTLVMVIGVVPVLVRVMGWAATCPRCNVPKFRLDVESPIAFTVSV